MSGAFHYSLGLDVLLPAEGLGRWTRPECLFVAMQQLQASSAVGIGLCDVLEAGAVVPWSESVTHGPLVYAADWPGTLAPVGAMESAAILEGLATQPRFGTFRCAERIRAALLVPWIQHAARLEQVGDFPLGGVTVLPLGILSRLWPDARAAALIQLSVRTRVPVAIVGSGFVIVDDLAVRPRLLT